MERMRRKVWGWCDVAPVGIRDPEEGTVVAVRMTTDEAKRLGVSTQRLVVFDAGDLLEVEPAEVVGMTEFADHDFCVHFSAPESGDWVLIGKRDGAKARNRRDTPS